jgi:hypothetical protein
LRFDTQNLFFIGSLLGSAGGLIRSILLKHCYLSNSKGLRDIQTNTLDIIQNAFGASKLIKDHLVFIYVSLLGIFCCLVLDYYLGTARFQNVKRKASCNAFPIYRFSLHLPTLLEDFGMRTATKLQNNFGIVQIFRKVFSRKLYVFAHTILFSSTLT